MIPVNSAPGMGHLMEVQQTACALTVEDAKAILNAMSDAVIATDRRGRIQYLNSSGARLLGRTPAELIGLPITDVLRLVHVETRQPIRNPVLACLLGGDTRRPDTPVLLVRDDCHEVQVDDSVAPTRGRAGDITGTVLILRDVSALRHRTRMLAYQATHDMLTGLANRREFERLLAEAVQNSRDTGDSHALLYLDMDRLKYINDSAGHEAGDEVLRQVTGTLRSQLRERDTLARLGGDEFGVILPECGCDDALNIAESLRNLVQEARVVWKGRCHATTLSVGVACIDAGTRSPDSILNAADSACYIAKRLGRNRVHLFERGVADTDRLDMPRQLDDHRSHTTAPE